VKEATTAEEPIVKTKTILDRSIKPTNGPDPDVNVPKPWTASLSNGMKIWGITQTELPLVQYVIKIEGGHKMDKMEKAGLANLVAAMMNEGTLNKTPEQLEDAIGLLGANIRINADNEEISVEVGSSGFRSSGGMLVRNFEKSLQLVEEMLLEPRWDKEQFALVKSRIVNGLRRSSASPEYLASKTLNKLIFGDNVLATEVTGTEKSVAAITLDDLKEYYANYFSPAVSKLLVVGNIDKDRVKKALASLEKNWKSKAVTIPAVKMPSAPEKSAIYFVDVPGAKQSVISIGAPSIPRSDPEFYPAYVANYKLGGSFNGVLNLILREEKGFTYGARSGFSGAPDYGVFIASSKVRTNSTVESVTIFKTEMEKYRQLASQEYVDFTKSSLLKGNALRFETLSGLMGMLSTMADNQLPFDYIKKEESYVKALTTETQQKMAAKYIDPAKMYYVVVGDAKTQMEPLGNVGLGAVIPIK
ncbi:MAG: insulinase family protein, partial [Marinilabiliales bacterium]|nr:insulinase family protein [Marinilabiliales bacterium]